MSKLGFLLCIDKPVGPTSREAVDQVSRVIGTRRLGHAGTLDPLASGVLVLAAGQATRLIEYVQRAPKTYEARVCLGQVSETGDLEAVTREVPVTAIPSRDVVETVAKRFQGTTSQVPPKFSALKVRGERAYDLSRRGETVTLAPRTVTIHAMTILEYEFPLVRLRIECGAGTYIRAIAQDLGEALGTGGVLTGLRRTGVGGFTVSRAVPLAEFGAADWHAHILPVEEAVAGLPTVSLDDDGRRRFILGQRIPASLPHEAQEIAAFDRGRHFLGIATYDPQRQLLQPTKGGFAED